MKVKPYIGAIVIVGTNQTQGTCAAIITEVHSDTCVNVTRFNKDGSIEIVTSVGYKEGYLEYNVDWQWPKLEKV